MIGMQFIKILHLDNKSLSHIPVDLLLNFKSLIEFTIRNNNITSIPNGVFQHLSALQTFDMTGNALATAGDGNFCGFHSLEYLNLCCNFINTLKKFQHVSALSTLNLSYNYISNIDKDVLEELSALNNLDISYNLIFAIDPGTFLRNQISTLHLTYNKIVNISFIPHPILLYNFSRDDNSDKKKYFSENSIEINILGIKIKCSRGDCWVKDGILKNWINTDVDLDCWDIYPNPGVEIMEMLLFLPFILFISFIICKVNSNFRFVYKE